jgi:hypothetical protein
MIRRPLKHISSNASRSGHIRATSKTHLNKNRGQKCQHTESANVDAFSYSPIFFVFLVLLISIPLPAMFATPTSFSRQSSSAWKNTGGSINLGWELQPDEGEGGAG